MRIDPAEQTPRDLYGMMIRAIVPRPIAWVSTRSAAGRHNLAPFSFFTGIVARPPTLCFAVGSLRDGALKDTARNILETEAFVVNVVPAALAGAMSQTSGDYPPDVDEAVVAQLETVPADRVGGRRVVGSPVQFECRLQEMVPIEDDGVVTARLMIGRIVLIHVADAVLGADGRIDEAKVDALGRLGGAGYCFTRDTVQVPRPKVDRFKAP